jgi:hypothetical protein
MLGVTPLRWMFSIRLTVGTGKPAMRPASNEMVYAPTPVRSAVNP